MMPRLPGLADLRQRLRVFDDPAIDALVLDHFPEVYDKFGRGQRRDEKINLLLDHCRRNPDDCKRLQELTHPVDELLLSYEVAMIHNFDLDELVDDCVDELLEKQGLVGFAVLCNSPILLQSFCERLKYVWGRSRVCLKPTLVINPFHMSIDKTILTIKRRYVPALNEGDVLFAVQGAEENTVNYFWQRLCDAVEGEELENRLIVIITINPGCILPEGVIQLSQPCFRPAHVFRWVSLVVRHLAWPEHIIQSWKDQIIAECSYGDELLVDWMYDHLEAMLDLLKQNPTVDRFQQELEKRRQIYVQTSH